MPFLHETWRWLRPGASFDLAGTALVDVTLRGLAFSHYPITDADGLGGTLHAVTGAPVEWAIARVK